MSTELLASFDDMLKQYKIDLSNHDWYYDDDNRYFASKKNLDRLIKLAEENGKVFKIAYNEEYAKHFNFFSNDRPYVPPFEV